MTLVHPQEGEPGLPGRSAGRHLQAARITGCNPPGPALFTPQEADTATSLTAEAPSFEGLRRWTGRYLPLAILGAALWATYHELHTYRSADIIASLHSLPIDAVIAAIALMTVGHLVHIGYDTLALRYAEHPLPWHRAAFGSLVTYSVSAVTGFTGMIGASLRYRFWSGWGLGRNEILKGVSFAVLTAGLGATATAAAALSWDPAALSLSTGVPAGALRVLGVALLGVTVGYLAACAAIRRPLTLGRVSFELPAPGLGLRQVVVATLDWTIAGWVFFVLLPSGSRLGLIGFLSLFLAAQVGGLLAHVPGGIGVFDVGMLWLLRPFTSPPQAAAALIAYRAIAYLLPVLLAVPALAGYEVNRRDASFARRLRRAERWWAAPVPFLLSVTTFLAGCVLLASGATPGIPSRLEWLGNVVPLGVIEAAHFLGSITGVGLLILARGLHRRLDAAYQLTVAALMVGIGASLLKGGD